MGAVPASLRRSNQRLVLERLLHGGPASRARLAEGLGISKPTMGKLVDDLLRDGVLEEVKGGNGDASHAAAPVSAVIGRPGRLVRIDRATPRLVLVQLGVRHTRIAAAALGGSVDEAWPAVIETPSSPGRWARSLKAAARRAPIDEPWGVVASVPGLVDERAGRVVFSPNLHWTEGAAVAEVLGETWGAPVRLVQEIRALALGHQIATGMNDFFLADFGDGVGGAAVIGGRLFDAPLPMTGEFGHTPVPGHDAPCGCGGRGCVETIVSRAAVMRAYRRHGGTGRWSGLVRHVAERGVPAWLGDALTAAGVSVAGAMNVLGLRHAVLTGSLVELGDAAVACVAKAVRAAAMWGRFGEVVVEAAPRRRAAGLVAAGIQRIVMPADDQTVRARSDPRDVEAVR